jgi:hypothetical protein
MSEQYLGVLFSVFSRIITGGIAQVRPCIKAVIEDSILGAQNGMGFGMQRGLPASRDYGVTR